MDTFLASASTGHQHTHEGQLIFSRQRRSPDCDNQQATPQRGEPIDDARAHASIYLKTKQSETKKPDVERSKLFLETHLCELGVMLRMMYDR